MLAELSSSVPPAARPPSSSFVSQQSSLYAHDEQLWALFVHHVHLACLPSVVRRRIEEFSSDAAAQAAYIVHMSAGCAFVSSSHHHYLNSHGDSNERDAAHYFQYSDGCQNCFDADVVKLVSQILNTDYHTEQPLGWQLILAQLQHCHVLSTGTHWSCISSASAAQAMSIQCRHVASHLVLSLTLTSSQHMVACLSCCRLR